MKEACMNTRINRIAIAMALLVALAMSGCATIGNPSWGSAGQSQQKLPGDSPG
jgi:uncharacterized protein YceK